MNPKKPDALPMIPGTELLPLPLVDPLLPTHSSTLISRKLWESVAGSAPLRPEDERVNELAFYLLFAALGLIGHDHDKTINVETLLVPLAFETGHFSMRVTTFRLREGSSVIMLSLPEERIPVP